jgi:predicted nucleic-acid-binding Zn-ribbon protein
MPGAGRMIYMKPCTVEIESQNLAPANSLVSEMQHACPRCGGTHFESGLLKIPHSGEVTFRLFKTSFNQRNPDISVNAEVCLSCGALELSADPEKARELLK